RVVICERELPVAPGAPGAAMPPIWPAAAPIVAVISRVRRIIGGGMVAVAVIAGVVTVVTAIIRSCQRAADQRARSEPDPHPAPSPSATMPSAAQPSQA